MAELFNKNYKSLYICSFIYTIIQLLAVIDFYKSSTVAKLVVSVVSYVVGTACLWCILEIVRGNKKLLFTFKYAIKNSIWLIILNIIKYMVLMFVVSVAGIILSLISFFVKDTAIKYCITTLIMYMANTLIIFSDFVYYDNKRRGPILAVYDGMTTAQNIMPKIFVAYIPFLIRDFLIYLVGINKIALVITFVVYPFYGLWLAILYNKTILNKGEINDSLIYVAKALDEKEN